MAGGAASFELSLLDKTSGPASTAAKQLEIVGLRLKALDRIEGKTEKQREKIRMQRLGLEIQQSTLLATRKTEEAAGSWLAKLDHGFNIAARIGGAAWGIAKGVAHTAIGWGEMAVEAAAAKEQQYLVFRNLLHGDAAAKRMLATLERLSDATPFGAGEMVGWGQRLIAGGFGAQDATSLLRTLADAAAATGASSEKVDAAVGAFRKIHTEGKLTTKTLKALGDVGISGGAIFDALGRELHMTADQAKALATKGKVGQGSLFDAIMGAVSSTRSGGKLGSAAAIAANESATVLLSKVKGRLERYLGNLYDTKGFAAFKGFLRNVLSATDIASESGQRIAEKLGGAFDRVFTALFGELSGADGLEKMQQLVSKIAGGIEMAGAAIGGFATGFGAAMKPALAALGLTFEGPLDETKLARIEETFRRMGESVGDLLVALAKIPGLLSRTVDQANLVLGGKESEGARYSGSWFDRGLAAFHRGEKRQEWWHEGSTLGQIGNVLAAPANALYTAGDVASSAMFGSGSGSSLSVPPPTAPEGAAFTPGASVSIQNVTQVDARGASREAAYSIAETTSAANEKAVAASFTRAAMSSGSM